jgi:hypothetical protein
MQELKENFPPPPRAAQSLVAAPPSHDASRLPARPRAVRCEHANVSFERPSNWVASTVTAFHTGASDGGGPGALTMLMQREPQGGDSLQTYVSRKLVQLSRQADKFHLFRSESLVVGGRPAVWLSFGFTTETGAAAEEDVVVVDRAGDAGGMVTVFSAGAMASARAGENRKAFLELLKTVRFEGGATVSRSPERTEPAAAWTAPLLTRPHASPRHEPFVEPLSFPMPGSRER